MSIQWFSESPDDEAYFARWRQHPELAFWLLTAKDISDFGARPLPIELRRLLLILGYSCTYGDLCIELSAEKIRKAEAKLQNRLEVAMPGLEAIVQFNWADLMQPAFEGVVSKGAETPLVLVQESERMFLYFQKHFVSRRSVMANIQNLATVRPDAWNAKPALDAFKKGVNERFTLAPEQRQAIALALHSSLTIVTGGPGTGKTTVIVGILRALVALGAPPREIRIVTPTGRAARRARQVIEASGDVTLRDIETSTLHSLLGFSRSRGDFRYSRENRIPYQAIILDELSMVDLGMMSRLLDSINPGKTRLILLGDRDQLPSVESGAVLGDLVELLLPENQAPGYSKGFLDFLKSAGESVTANIFEGSGILTDSIVELKASHRSGEVIREASREINQGRMPAWIRTREPIAEGCGQIEVKTDTEFLEVLKAWGVRFFNAGFLKGIERAASLNAEGPEAQELSASMLAQISSQRILAFTRHGERGTARINRILRQQAYDLGLPFEDERHAGMPLMIIQNDYRRRIYNGETGLLLRFKNGFRWVFVEADRIVALAPAALPQTEAAHAITVHKSQGSEYDNVVIVMPAELDHPILSRQILYTGLTRAKKAVTVVGSTESIQAALEKKAERETGGLRNDRVI